MISKNQLTKILRLVLAAVALTTAMPCRHIHMKPKSRPLSDKFGQIQSHDANERAATPNKQNPAYHKVGQRKNIRLEHAVATRIQLQT